MIIKRVFDIIFSLALIVFLSWVVLLIIFGIKLSSRGTILFWQERVGMNSRVFKMPKFRTMIMNTPNVATDLLQDVEKHITSFGSFLRAYSLDELPQLFSILKGDMSFVGPRPALCSQYELIKLREKYGIDTIKPGVTGWAQVNGRDELSIDQKVAYETQYKEQNTFFFDIYIILLTVIKALKKEGVAH